MIKIELKDMELAVKKIQEAKAAEVKLWEESISGVPCLILEFHDLNGDSMRITLAESASGGFNYISTKRRLTK